MTSVPACADATTQTTQNTIRLVPSQKQASCCRIAVRMQSRVGPRVRRPTGNSEVTLAVATRMRSLQRLFPQADRRPGRGGVSFQAGEDPSVRSPGEGTTGVQWQTNELETAPIAAPLGCSQLVSELQVLTLALRVPFPQSALLIRAISGPASQIHIF